MPCRNNCYIQLEHRDPPHLFIFFPHFSDVWTINGRCWWLCLWLNPTVGFLSGVKRVAAGRTQYLPPVLQDVWCPGIRSSSKSFMLFNKLVCCTWNGIKCVDFGRAWLSSSFITVAVAEQLSQWWEICSWVGSNGHLKSMWGYWYSNQSHILSILRKQKGKSKSQA